MLWRRRYGGWNHKSGPRRERSCEGQRRWPESKRNPGVGGGLPLATGVEVFAGLAFVGLYMDESLVDLG
jgi:hypothetical protein